MATFMYELVPTNEGIIVEIRKDNELIIHQPINPETGAPFSSEEEARAYAESVVKELQMQEVMSNPPHLSIKFLNPATDEVIKIAKVGEPIKVSVELYYPLSETEKIFAPITGDYLVPYYVDNIQAGSAIIHIENGKGEGIIRINKSGIYSIMMDKVLNLETMRQPEPLPILEENPSIVIAEELTTDMTTS